MFGTQRKFPKAHPKLAARIFKNKALSYLHIVSLIYTLILEINESTFDDVSGDVMLQEVRTCIAKNCAKFAMISNALCVHQYTASLTSALLYRLSIIGNIVEMAVDSKRSMIYILGMLRWVYHNSWMGIMALYFLAEISAIFFVSGTYSMISNFS